MKKWKVGDIVSRKSYNNDILFKVASIEEIDNDCIYILKAINYRLQADANESDLVQFNVCRDNEHEKDNKFGGLLILDSKK